MPDGVSVIRVGTHIESNGGEVLACKQGSSPNTTVVLCYLPQNKVTPFVVHTYSETQGICYRGQYGWTLEEAMNYYDNRRS